jgi:hypothetical protein
MCLVGFSLTKGVDAVFLARYSNWKSWTEAFPSVAYIQRTSSSVYTTHKRCEPCILCKESVKHTVVLCLFWPNVSVLLGFLCTLSMASCAEFKLLNMNTSLIAFKVHLPEQVLLNNGL